MVQPFTSTCIATDSQNVELQRIRRLGFVELQHYLL